MVNFNDFLVNILIQQITIIMVEQGEKRIDLNRVNDAIIGATNAVSLLESLNDSGLTSIDRETIDTLMAKFQLNNNLLKSIGDNVE